MMIAKTEIRVSPIKGLGLFATEDIKKGTVVWQDGNALSDLVLSEQEWNALVKEMTPESYRQVRKYAYKYKKDNQIYLNLDDARFFNHSENPNVGDAEIENIALHDIAKGEELLVNYRTFYEKDWFEETMKM